jgi:hypothetical protein
MKVAERAAKLAGLDMPAKLAIAEPDGRIPLESVRRMLDRLDAETGSAPSDVRPLRGVCASDGSR